VAVPALSLVDRQISVRLFLLSFVCYAYFYAGGGWNQNSQFDLTRAIVERHTFALDGLQQNSGDISTYRGHTYSNKSPGISFLAAIPYAIVHAMESTRGIDPAASIVETFNCYVATVFTCGLTGALVPMLLYRLARRRFVDRRWAATVALVIALGTELWAYSTLLMLHVPSAAMLFLGFALLPETGEACASRRRGTWAGLAAGMSALSNYLCVPAVGVLGLLTMIRRRGDGDSGQVAGAFALGALPPLLLLGIYQKITCGGFFRTPIDTMDARFVTRHAFLGILRLPQWDAFWGITF
jgi:4-amino-4-deoxy-L-arabinose transferase-like glycosyltransferase